MPVGALRVRRLQRQGSVDQRPDHRDVGQERLSAGRAMSTCPARTARCTRLALLIDEMIHATSLLRETSVELRSRHCVPDCSRVGARDGAAHAQDPLPDAPGKGAGCRRLQQVSRAAARRGAAADARRLGRGRREDADPRRARRPTRTSSRSPITSPENFKGEAPKPINLNSANVGRSRERRRPAAQGSRCVDRLSHQERPVQYARRSEEGARRAVQEDRRAPRPPRVPDPQSAGAAVGHTAAAL